MQEERNRMSVACAAELMNASEYYVRRLLQNAAVPWGYAVKGKGNRWMYWISRKKFEEITGIPVKEVW